MSDTGTGTNAGTAGAGTGTQGGSGEYDWKSAIKDPSIRNHSSTPSFKAATPEEAIEVLAKMNVNSQHLIGGSAGKIDPLKPDFTPEQEKQWWNRNLGVPERPEGYKLDTAPYKDVATQEKVERLTKSAVNANLTPKQLSTLANDIFRQEMADRQAEIDSTKQNLQVFDSKIRAKYGDKLTEANDYAKFAADNGSPELKELVKTMPELVKHPGIFDTMVQLGKVMANDSAAGAFRGSGNNSIGGLPNTSAEVNAEINRWHNDEFHAKVFAAGNIENLIRQDNEKGIPTGNYKARWESGMKVRTALYKRQAELKAAQG